MKLPLFCRYSLINQVKNISLYTETYAKQQKNNNKQYILL